MESTGKTAYCSLVMVPVTGLCENAQTLQSSIDTNMERAEGRERRAGNFPSCFITVFAIATSGHAWRLVAGGVLAAAFVSPQLASATNTTVRMITTLGTIDIQLYDDQAPITVANFLRYAGRGYYSTNLADSFQPSRDDLLPQRTRIRHTGRRLDLCLNLRVRPFFGYYYPQKPRRFRMSSLRRDRTLLAPSRWPNCPAIQTARPASGLSIWPTTAALDDTR